MEMRAEAIAVRLLSKTAILSEDEISVHIFSLDGKTSGLKALFPQGKFDGEKYIVPLSEKTLGILLRGGFAVDQKIRMKIEMEKLRHQILQAKKSISVAQIPRAVKEYPYKLTPMAHQLTGISFILSDYAGVLIGDEPGVGKTMQAGVAADILLTSGQMDNLLIVCPKSLRRNWARELEKHTRLDPNDPRIRIVNYDIIWREPLRSDLLSWVGHRTIMIADEAHRWKNKPKRVKKQKTKEIDGIPVVVTEREFDGKSSQMGDLLSSKVGKIVLLTGTPCDDKPEDAWHLLFIMRQEGLQTYWNFIDEFCTRGGTFSAWQITGYKNLEKFREVVWRQGIRRRKSECLDLPEKVFQDIPVELPADQWALYEKMREEAIIYVSSLDDGVLKPIEAKNALSMILRLSQIASNPGILDAGWKGTPGKWEALDEIISDALDDPLEKVIIWTWYQKNNELLRKRYGAAGFHGGASENQRDKEVQRFISDPKCRVLVSNPAAGGIGLNLIPEPPMKCTTMAYTEMSWKLSYYLQSQDRFHRQGQKYEVRVIRLMAENSVDDYIAMKVDQKKQIAEFIHGDSDSTDWVQPTREELLKALKGGPRGR